MRLVSPKIHTIYITKERIENVTFLFYLSTYSFTKVLNTCTKNIATDESKRGANKRQ